MSEFVAPRTVTLTIKQMLSLLTFQMEEPLTYYSVFLQQLPFPLTAWAGGSFSSFPLSF